MDFSDALEAMRYDQLKVKRKGWGGYWFIPITSVYVHDVAEEPMSPMIVARTKEGYYAPATPYQSDLLADDWEIVE